MDKRFDQLKKKYPYVYAWGKLMGSYNYYIENQMELAEKENAPKNATFRKDNGGWNTTTHLQPHTIAELNEYIAGTKGGHGL